MTKIHRLADLPSQLSNDSKTVLDNALRGCVVSIGNFDGVHRGHASLLDEVNRLSKDLANKTGEHCPKVVVVFDPHPAAILRPDRVPPRLTWMERRAELLGYQGIDHLVVCETTKDFLSLSAEEFFRRLIVDRLNAKAIVEGPNFFFGRGRGGNVDTLRQLSEQSEIQCAIVPPSEMDDEMISSTRIRGFIEAGEIEKANDCLTQPYQIRGVVNTGEQRGRTIGFPTANLTDTDVVVPGMGVYGGVAWTDNDPQRRFVAAIHIGPNPTFENSDDAKLEVHLLDFEEDIYGKRLVVEFRKFVREVVRFGSAEELTQQLDRDVATIRNEIAAKYKSRKQDH